MNRDRALPPSPSSMGEGEREREEKVTMIMRWAVLHRGITTTPCHCTGGRLPLLPCTPPSSHTHSTIVLGHITYENHAMARLRRNSRERETKRVNRLRMLKPHTQRPSTHPLLCLCPLSLFQFSHFVHANSSPHHPLLLS